MEGKKERRKKLTDKPQNPVQITVSVVSVVAFLGLQSQQCVDINSSNRLFNDRLAARSRNECNDPIQGLDDDR